MTDLNENHRRILFHLLESVDHSLFGLECALNPISLRSPFRSPITGLTDAQREIVRGFSKRMRARMCAILSAKAAEVAPEEVSLARAVRPYLLAIQISLEELGPRHMKGYGDLSAGARRELEDMAAELQGLVAQFAAELNQ